MKSEIIDIAKYAYEHVPFYRKLYKNNKIDVYSDLDIMDLPIIKKDDIIDYPEMMISDEYQMSDLVKTHTSGTTGMQLFLYNSKEEQLRRAMLMWKERNQNCSNIIKEKKAMFYDIRELEDPPIQFIDGMMYYNTTYLDDDRFYKYYQSMNDYQPGFINCSPSAFYEFMRYMKRSNIKLNYTIKYIEFMGEYVSEGMYREFTQFFEGSIIINYYGSFEFYSMAHGCKNNKLHEANESVYIEVPDKDSDGFGNMIVTSLINRAMPLIRYDIGDVGRIATNNCSCGKKGRIIELKSGGIYDYFLDGRRKITADLFRKVLTEYFIMKNDSDNFIQFSLKEYPKGILTYNVLTHRPINVNEITEFLYKKINSYTKTDVKVVVNTELNMLAKTGIKFRMYDLLGKE